MRIGSWHYGGIFDYDAKSERLQVVNAELENADVWNDPKHAQELGREKKSLETTVQTLSDIDTGLTDAQRAFRDCREPITTTPRWPPSNATPMP